MPDNSHAPSRPRWSFPIGTVAGIQIRVHASFFLLVALFALVGSAPKGPGVLPALVWLVLIFACVVFHELSHCLVGRRHGLVVHEIDLLPIGGVSRLESFPENPRDEFAMAIAGPAASAGLGVLAAVLAVALSMPLFPIDFLNGPLLPRLAWLNLLLAAFNMIPAFPLDGGRVFRALLERRYDMARATQIAGRAGRLFALLLVGVGVFWNLWLAIIGVFVYFGASAEESATLIHLRLVGRRVRDAMLTPPTTIDASVDATALQQLVRRNCQGVFPGRAAGPLRRCRRRRRHRAGAARKPRRRVRRPHRSGRRARRRPRGRHPRARGDQRARGRRRRRRTGRRPPPAGRGQPSGDETGPGVGAFDADTQRIPAHRRGDRRIAAITGCARLGRAAKRRRPAARSTR